MSDDGREFVRRVMLRYPTGTDSHLPGVRAGQVFPLIELLGSFAAEGRKIVGLRQNAPYQPGFQRLGALVDRAEDLLGPEET